MQLLVLELGEVLYWEQVCVPKSIPAQIYFDSVNCDWRDKL